METGINPMGAMLLLTIFMVTLMPHGRGFLVEEANRLWRMVSAMYHISQAEQSAPVLEERFDV